MIIITECTLFLQKDMKEKIFIPISKTFSVSQRDVSSNKNKYNAAVSIAISKRNPIEVQLEDHYKIELPKTNQVREFLCYFAVLRQTYCRIK